MHCHSRSVEDGRNLNTTKSGLAGNSQPTGALLDFAQGTCGVLLDDGRLPLGYPPKE
jgi:hypothetical protein